MLFLDWTNNKSVLKQLKLVIFGVSLLGVFSGSCEFEEIDYREPVPVALEASEITSSSFLASWNPVEGGRSYTILVSTDNSLDENSFVKGYPATTNKTSFRVTGLEADQTYYYRIKVTNDNPKVAYSDVITVETLPLAAPQILDPVNVTPLSFVAQWQSVPEAEGYRLYVSTDANFTEHLNEYNGKLISDTIALVENLEVNADYFYRVKTTRSKSISQASDLMRVSTSRLIKPKLVDASEIGYTSITINWETVEGATSYLIFVATDQFVITNVLSEYNSREVTDATSLVVVGLNANTTYYYRVQAKNDQSESEKSDIGFVSTVRLKAPVARAATGVQIDGFRANWDSVVNASSYVLDISRNETFTDFLTGYKAKEVVDTLEVVSGLLRNTNYYYRVRSKGFGAVSENSKVITVRTTFFASPKALEAIELQSTSFRAVWQPVKAADSYRLDVATDANFDNILSDYNNLKITDTTQIITGLTVNNQYFYRVRALKGSVFSGYSNIIDLTTTRLSEPRLLATTNIELRSFTINWESVSGAVRYRVDVGFDPLVENKIATDYDNRIVNGTSLNVMGLDANRIYYFKVRAENNVSTGGSTTGSAKTASISPPVVADPDSVQLTSFRASWSGSANAESYLLDVAIDVGFKNLVAGFNAREIVGTSQSVTGLQPNTTYYYRVKAKGLGSTSDYSATKTVATSPLPPPVVLNATAREVYEFTANWKKTDGADRYLLYVATDPSFSAGSFLNGYNGKVVLDTSYVVTGLNPYTTYYYRLQSKQSSSVSEFSATYATVDACIATGCRLNKRTFTDWREETYSYTNGLVTGIQLYDIEGGASTIIRECRNFIYNANNRIESVIVDSANAFSTDQFWKFTYEDYNVDQQRIKEIIIEEIPLTTNITKIDFTYDGFGKLINLRYSNGEIVNPGPTDTLYTITSEENYSYGSNQILVTDTNGDIIKEVILGTDFNTESMLLSDLALLMFNPTDKMILPFITHKNFTYYRYRDNASSSWNNYPYSYEYNTKGIPTKIRPTNSIPELIYGFNPGCNF